MISRNGSIATSGRRSPRVVIIGGGFSGAMTAANLLRRAASPIEIVLIEPRVNVGAGLAYSTTDHAHLLNVPAAKMGAYPDDIAGFHHWARSQLGPRDPSAFLPRAAYGQYVAATLAAAVESAQCHASLVRLREEAVGVAGAPEHPRVRLIDGRTIDADHIVLALGSGPPRIPAPVAELPAERVITTPFAPGALEQVGDRERLLILGAGLTMYDAAISLARRGFAGEAVAMSRRGRTPNAHQRYDAPPWSDAWAASLGCLITNRALTRAVRDALRRAERDGADWRAVIDAMRPYLQRIWANLPEPERVRFVERLSPHWEVARHRCAPEVAAAIALLRERGMLRIGAGRLRSCEMRRGRVVAHIQRRGGSGGSSEQFDRVLVCAGPETDVMRWSSPLMRDLLAQSLVAPDPLRLGLRTTKDGRAIGRDGAATAWLRIVGPLRKANLWESTAVPELRVQAADAAESIHRDLLTQTHHATPDRAERQKGSLALELKGDIP